MLFPLASSAQLHPYLQCVHSAALVAKVSPLATVSGLPIVLAAQWYFTVWLVGHLVTGLFGIVSPLPPLPLYILVVGGCYSLAYLQSSGSFYLPVVFSFLYFNGFHYYYYYYYYYCYHYFTLVYFDQPPMNVFQCDWCPCLCCLILFCLFLHWSRGSWLGCGYCWAQGWFHPAGLGCWPTVGLFWAPDLHLHQMLFMDHKNKTCNKFEIIQICLSQHCNTKVRNERQIFNHHLHSLVIFLLTGSQQVMNLLIVDFKVANFNCELQL